jgi:hypothetical protein
MFLLNIQVVCIFFYLQNFTKKYNEFALYFSIKSTHNLSLKSLQQI